MEKLSEILVHVVGNGEVPRERNQKAKELVCKDEQSFVRPSAERKVTEVKLSGEPEKPEKEVMDLKECTAFNQPSGRSSTKYSTSPYGTSSNALTILTSIVSLERPGVDTIVAVVEDVLVADSCPGMMASVNLVTKMTVVKANKEMIHLWLSWQGSKVAS